MASNDLHQRVQCPYKKLTDRERAAISEFATQHGRSRENIVKHYCTWLVRMKKGKVGRPLILGEEMDHEAQDFIMAQRSNGAVSTVIGIGKGIVMRHNKFYPRNLEVILVSRSTGQNRFYIG